MKKGFICIGVLVGFLLSILLVSGAFAQQKAKDEYVLKVAYGDVKFTHKKHAETLKIDCVKCHHEMKGKKPGEAVQGCKSCHKAKTEGKVLSSKDAYHKDCKGCHEEAKKASKPAGPTGCTACHIKAKK
jgi:hypothetical protein